MTNLENQFEFEIANFITYCNRPVELQYWCGNVMQIPGELVKWHLPGDFT